MVHFSTSPVMVVIGDFSESGEDRLETNDMWEEDVWGFKFHSFLPLYSHCHGGYNKHLLY